MQKFLVEGQTRSQHLDTELRQHISYERSRTSDDITGVKRLLTNIEEDVSSEFKHNRVRLNWVIGVMCATLCLLAAMAIRMWTQ